MDIANLCLLFNNLGQESFCSPDSLNIFLSNESKSKTPYTSHSRIRSLRRYIKFLTSYDYKKLPNTIKLTKLLNMMEGVEKTLLRQRNKRHTHVRTKNRSNYFYTVQVIEEWRKLRTLSNALQLFENYNDDPNLLLSSSNYRIMRDFLICEVLISNGQRSGIISGMLISEVNSAKFQINSGYHFILVSEHKTGYTHPATIFYHPTYFVNLYIY